MTTIDMAALRDTIKRGDLEQVKSMLPPVIAIPEPILGTVTVDARYDEESGIVAASYAIKVSESRLHLAVQTARIVTGGESETLIGGAGSFLADDGVHATEYHGTVAAVASPFSGQTLHVVIWGWLSNRIGEVAVLAGETSIRVP